MILGLLAIPFLTVTATSLLADVASTTDPAAALTGVPAAFCGVLCGGLFLRLVRAAHSGAVALGARCASLASVAIRLVVVVPSPAPDAANLRPAVAMVPSRVGRRGPPTPRR